jgi:hypothetical protein
VILPTQDGAATLVRIGVPTVTRRGSCRPRRAARPEAISLRSGDRTWQRRQATSRKLARRRLSRQTSRRLRTTASRSVFATQSNLDCDRSRFHGPFGLVSRLSFGIWLSLIPNSHRGAAGLHATSEQAAAGKSRRSPLCGGARPRQSISYLPPTMYTRTRPKRPSIRQRRRRWQVTRRAIRNQRLLAAGQRLDRHEAAGDTRGPSSGSPKPPGNRRGGLTRRARRLRRWFAASPR